MNAHVLIPVLCAGVTALAQPRWEYIDILQAPPSVLDAAASNALQLIADLRIGSTVVDYGVVGSYAHGCARLAGDDPSDLDIVIYVTTNALALNLWFTRDDQHRTYGRYEKAFKDSLGFPHGVGIKFWEARHLFPGDPEFNFYSLKTRTMRGRPGNLPRQIKNYIIGDTYINVDRNTVTQRTAIARIETGVPPHVLYISNRFLYFGFSPSNIAFALPAVTAAPLERQ